MISVETSNPVYSNFSITPEQKEKAQKFLQSAKSGIGLARDSGILQGLKGRRANKKLAKEQVKAEQKSTSGMSKGLKIGLIVGGVLLVGGIITVIVILKNKK